FPLSAILYSYWLSLFSYIAPPPTSIYTLSLHDALPISLVGVGVLEPWVGADELEERLQVALEAHALLQCLHLAAQPLDFVQADRSEEHTSELQSRENLVCRLLLEKKKYILILLTMYSIL